MRLGLVGCGSIGGAVVRAIERGSLPEVKLIGIADHVESQSAVTLAASLNVPLLAEVPSLLLLKPDLVLETASADAIRKYASDIFDCGADLMMVSVGALADADFFGALIEKAKAKNRRLHI